MKKLVIILAVISATLAGVSAYLALNLAESKEEIEANRYRFVSACEFDREGQKGPFTLTCDEVYELEVNDIYKNCLEATDVDHCVGKKMGWY